MSIQLETEEFKYINGTPETLKRYGFQKINDTTFAWYLNDEMNSIFTLDTTKGIFTWFKGDALADKMISELIQDMLNEEVIEHHYYYEDDVETDPDDVDTTMVCAACGEEPDPDTNYCPECGEYVEPVPRYQLD